MKLYKKIVTMLSTLSMLAAMCTAPVQAADTPLTIFTDNVESHTVYTQVGSSSTTDIENGVAGIAGGYGYAGSTGDVLVENTWAVSPTFGGNKTEYRIRYDKTAGTTSADDTDTDNQVIALSTGTIKNSLQNALTLTADVGNESDFLYSVDMRNYYTSAKKFVTPVSGIRIVDPADETNYYELALISDSDTAADRDSAKVNPPRFTKVSGAEYATPAAADVGDEPNTWLYTEYGPEGTASGYYGSTPKTYYFTLTLAKSGNTICWSILDQATNEIVWEDSYVDADPLFDGMGQLQLFTYGKTMKGATTVFDNVTVKKAGTALFKYNMPEETVSDDMEDYTLNGDTNGVWTASEAFGSDSGTKYSIGYDKKSANSNYGDDDIDLEDNQVLWMWAAGGQMALNYNGAPAHQYSVNLRNYSNEKANNPVMGIRLTDPNDETNYYELALISTTEQVPLANSSFAPPRFMKVQGGKADTPAVADTAPTECVYQDTGKFKSASGCYNNSGYKTYWFTLTMEKIDNHITWKAVDASTGEVLWTAGLIDEDPLFDGMGNLQVFTYGGSSAVLVDNVVCTTEGDWGLRAEAVWAKDDVAAPTLLVADYDESGKLVDAQTVTVSTGNIGYYLSNNVFSFPEKTKKAFLWENGSLQPVADSTAHIDNGVETCVVTYPSFTTKAATISIDDGRYEYDKTILEVMKKYGIRGTFNLITANNNHKQTYLRNDVEIANHTTHIRMYITEDYTEDDGTITTPPTYEECIESIETTRNKIESVTGVTPVGLIWPYTAPEKRDFYPELMEYVREHYKYARPVYETHNFDLPEDWYNWNATAWIWAWDRPDTGDGWIYYTKKFIEQPFTDELQLLYLDGHGGDLDATEMRSMCETTFSMLQGDEIWKATNLEIYTYVEASRQLEITDEYVYNPTSERVYMLINGDKYIAEPYSYAVYAY